MSDVPAVYLLPSSGPGPDAGGRPSAGSRDAQLRDAARKFEAVFLAEMLRQAGFGRMSASFNGGAGEAAFSGALIQEYAARIAEAGGLGIAALVAAAEEPGAAPSDGSGR